MKQVKKNTRYRTIICQDCGKTVKNVYWSTTRCKDCKKKHTKELRKNYTVHSKITIPPNFTFCTHEKIADELGITRERVRQIEQTALRKLKRNKDLQELYTRI